jgi:hypothetical protein
MVRGFLYIGLLTFLGCKVGDDAVAEEQTTGQLSISISHTFDGLPLVRDSFYAEPNNGKVSVTNALFYLSNFKLITADGEEISLPETYFLVDEADPKSKMITIKQIPPGNYKGIKFLAGIDSARNVSGIQTGALDPSLGMFWTWKSGYIQLKLEGLFIDADGQAEYIHHLGGFSGENNTVQSIELDFTVISLNAGQKLNVAIQRDIAEWFKTPFALSLRTYKVIIDEGQQARNISVNAIDMFSVQSAIVTQ